MITDEEVVSALCQYAHDSKKMLHDPPGYVRVMADWVSCELTKRHGEQAERDKPIDANWLKSIGGERIGIAWFFKGAAGRLINKEWLIGYTIIARFNNRGELLDMLTVLRRYNPTA